MGLLHCVLVLPFSPSILSFLILVASMEVMYRVIRQPVCRVIAVMTAATAHGNASLHLVTKYTSVVQPLRELAIDLLHRQK